MNWNRLLDIPLICVTKENGYSRKQEEIAPPTLLHLLVTCVQFRVLLDFNHQGISMEFGDKLTYLCLNPISHVVCTELV